MVPVHVWFKNAHFWLVPDPWPRQPWTAQPGVFLYHLKEKEKFHLLSFIVSLVASWTNSADQSLKATQAPEPCPSVKIAPILQTPVVWKSIERQELGLMTFLWGVLDPNLIAVPSLSMVSVCKCCLLLAQGPSCRPPSVAYWKVAPAGEKNEDK